MAKDKKGGSGAGNYKVTFGERKGGKLRKTRGPKDKKIKAYRGQGH